MVGPQTMETPPRAATWTQRSVICGLAKGVERMKSVRLALLVLGAACCGGVAAGEGNQVVLRSAPRVQFPGVINKDMNPQEPGDVDCSSPAHWDGGTMYMFYSTGHPFRSSGPDLFHLSRPSQRTNFDNEATWKMGARWIEATHKAHGRQTVYVVPQRAAAAGRQDGPADRRDGLDGQRPELARPGDHL